jgi:hypothetical protein
MSLRKGAVMERLTMKTEDGYERVSIRTKNQQLIDKLAYYEDLEEQRRLVKLPCKVGDAVWQIMVVGVQGKNIQYGIFKAVVITISVDYQMNFLLSTITEDEERYRNKVTSTAIGETMFFTKSESEARLKELNEKNQELKSLEVEKMSDKQSNLTDKEMEDLQNIVTDTLASVCAMANKHNIDRDSMLKYFADMLTAFAEVASIQNYETNHTCDSQHNGNSRDSEPCYRYDSRTAKINKVKINSLEIIVRMIDNKPYYEIKYKKVGEDYYHVGYSSFNIDNVLKWRDECFELVESDREERSEKSE